MWVLKEGSARVGKVVIGVVNGCERLREQHKKHRFLSLFFPPWFNFNDHQYIGRLLRRPLDINKILASPTVSFVSSNSVETAKRKKFPVSLPSETLRKINFARSKYLEKNCNWLCRPDCCSADLIAEGVVAVAKVFNAGNRCCCCHRPYSNN